MTILKVQEFLNVNLSGSKFFRAESDEQVRLKYRTECWLEWCIYHERICSPDEHISFRPLQIETPVPGRRILAFDMIARL
jgi:DNA replication regulator DPB11